MYYTEMRRIKLKILLFPLILLPTLALAESSVKVSDAWIREAPPGIGVAAGYLQLENRSGQAMHLIAAESDAFGSIEFHLSSVEKGVAKMQRQEKITIPAHAEFSFTPGGYHLMLFNHASPVQAGQIIKLRLIFADGSSQLTYAEVKRLDQ